MAILSILGALEEEDIIAGMNHEAPRLREQSIRWAESRLKTNSAFSEQVLGRLEDEAFRVRWQAALSVGELPIDRRVAALAELAARDGDDPWMRVAILCSSADGPGAMLDGLWKVKEADRPELVEGLVSLIGSTRSKEAWAGLMNSLVDQSESTRRRVLAALAQVAGTADARELLAEVVKGRPAEPVLIATLESSRRLATDSSANVGERVRSIESLALDPAPDLKNWAGLLKAHEPREVQLAALAILGRSNEAEVGGLIVDAWPSTTPSLRSELLEVLLARADRQRALIEGMEKGLIAASQLTSSARTRLMASSDAEWGTRAKKIVESLSGNRSAIVAKYHEARSSAVDLTVGRKVFERECATCHKLRGIGQEVGPNLATIQGRSPQQLLQNILDPNVEVLPSFVEVSVVLEDGRVASGMIASENANSVTLKRAEGIVQTISRDSMESISSTGKSLMPEGLEQKISPVEMSHLIGYLLDATDTSKITGKR